MPPLTGKIVAVTGSSSGIGRQTAIDAARQGADIIVHARAESEKIDSVRAEIEQHNVKSHAMFADFSVTGSYDTLVQSAWDWQGRVDGWVNNAGGDVLTGGWPDRSLEEKLDYLTRVDVAATLFLSRAVGKLMVAATAEQPTPGMFSIVNVGWDQAWQGMAGDSGELFATTKGAIMSMSKSLAQSLAPAVRVNCVAPGWIKTAWGDEASPYWDQRAQAESLMGRWGQPEDVANVTTWLLSPQSSFVSGQIIPVNGGFKTSNQAGPD